MTRQTEAQRLAKALAHDYSTEDETAASNELIRLDARESQLIALLRQARELLADSRVDVARAESANYMHEYYDLAIVAIDAAIAETTGDAQ